MGDAKTYKTTDFYLAAFLEMSGHPVKFNHIKGRQFEFEFDSSDELKDFVSAYYSKQVKVDPVEFINQVRMLKTRLNRATPAKFQTGKRRKRRKPRRKKKGGGSVKSTGVNTQSGGAIPSRRTKQVEAKGGNNGNQEEKGQESQTKKES